METERGKSDDTFYGFQTPEAYQAAKEAEMRQAESKALARFYDEPVIVPVLTRAQRRAAKKAGAA